MSRRYAEREDDDYRPWEGATPHLRTSAYDRRTSSSRRQADLDNEIEDTLVRREILGSGHRNTGYSNHASSQRRVAADSLRHGYGSERSDRDDHMREDTSQYARDFGSARLATAGSSTHRRDHGEDDESRRRSSSAYSGGGVGASVHARSSAYSRNANSTQPPSDAGMRRRSDQGREDPSSSDGVQHRPSVYSRQRNSTDLPGYENSSRQRDRDHEGANIRQTTSRSFDESLGEEDQGYAGPHRITTSSHVGSRGSRHDTSWQNDRETETWQNSSGTGEWKNTYSANGYWQSDGDARWPEKSSWEGADAKSSWPAWDEQNNWKDDSSAQWTDDRPKGTSNINFEAKGSNLTCSRDLIKKVRAGDTNQNADTGGLRGNSHDGKQSESDSSSSSKSKTRKRKNKRKKRSSSSTSSSSKKSVQDKVEEDRISKIKNAARINRIKKRKEAAKECVASDDLVVVESQATECTQPAGETLASSADKALETLKIDKPNSTAPSIDAAEDDLVVVEAKTSACIQPAGETQRVIQDPLPDSTKPEMLDLSVVSIDD